MRNLKYDKGKFSDCTVVKREKPETIAGIWK